MLRTSLSIAAIASLAFAGTAFARDQIRIVGSSTVYPFATTVAEQFGKATNFKTPVVESGGSSVGKKGVCEGIGTEFIDIGNASSRMKSGELEFCEANGISPDMFALIEDHLGVQYALDRKANQIFEGRCE